MCLCNYLNPGDDYSNIKFFDTSKRLSEEKYKFLQKSNYSCI